MDHGKHKGKKSGARTVKGSARHSGMTPDSKPSRLRRGASQPKSLRGKK